MIYEMLLNKLVEDATKENPDGPKFTLEFERDEVNGFFALHLRINELAAFTEFSRVPSDSTHSQILTVRRALTERLFNSVLKMGLNNLNEWYQKQKETKL